MMRLSDKGAEHLTKLEGGAVLKAYPDQGGKLTIGVGHLLTKTELKNGTIFIKGRSISWRDGITYQEAMDLLAADASFAEHSITSRVIVPLSQHQYDALVSFVFNAGVPAFQTSTLLRQLNKKEYDLVPYQMRLWVWITKSGNRVKSKGLINRREAEVHLWETGEYKA